jgi:hypothetical protein
LLDTLARCGAGIDSLRGLTTEAQRDPASVALTNRVKRYGEAVREKASDGDRRLFSGTTADIVAGLRALRDLGVSAVDIDFERSDPAAYIPAEMRRFEEVVLSRPKSLRIWSGMWSLTSLWRKGQDPDSGDAARPWRRRCGRSCPIASRPRRAPRP